LEEGGVSGMVGSYIQNLRSSKREICSFPIIFKKDKISVQVIYHETIHSLIWKE
jgi:hypothetical protein